MEPAVPAYARLLWLGEEDGRPGPRRSLDPHSLARAGIRLADTAGLDAVSMRTVSAALGMSSMALYRYVSSKQELLLIMVDEACGPPPDLPPGQCWQDGLRDWARASRDRLRAHPWILSVPVTEPAIAPNQVQWMERGLAVLAATGLAEHLKLSCLLLVSIYARGQTQLALGFEAAASAGQDPGARFGRQLLALASPERFPLVTAAMTASPAAGAGSDFGTGELSFGLSTIISGIEALIAAQAPGRGQQGGS